MSYRALAKGGFGLYTAVTTDDEETLRAVEAEMVAKLGPAHDMAALNGPQCGCGEPSTHESGWCGRCSPSRPVSVTL